MEKLAALAELRQHQAVTAPVLRRAPFWLMLCVGALAAFGACDADVTSLGVWEPALQQPPSAGQAGVAGSSGAGGSGGVAGEGGGAAGAAGEGAAAGAGGASESPPPGLYLEAEDGELSGFTIGSDAAASGGQYIQGPADETVNTPPGSASARYTFDLPSDGTYVIWGRIYSPDISSNRFWFQLDGGDWYLWRITVGNIWYWNYFHNDIAYNDTLNFPLSAGQHTLLISNAVPGARLDELYVTSGGDQPLGNTTACYPPHSIDVDGVCQKSCGAQAPPGMHTSCKCDGLSTFYAYDCVGFACCIVP